MCVYICVYIYTYICIYIYISLSLSYILTRENKWSGNLGVSKVGHFPWDGFQIEHLSENTQVSSCLGAKIQGFGGSQGTRIDPEDPKHFFPQHGPDFFRELHLAKQNLSTQSWCWLEPWSMDYDFPETLGNGKSSKLTNYWLSLIFFRGLGLNHQPAEYLIQKSEHLCSLPCQTRPGTASLDSKPLKRRMIWGPSWTPLVEGMEGNHIDLYRFRQIYNDLYRLI